MNHVNTVSFIIVLIMFALVTGIGFAAARWRPAKDRMHLNEWGLGGRGFGTFISWFLLGGDLYTAYTFIAVPALVYATGAAGFYALSYSIMVFPIVFIFASRLWSIARAHNYITPADFIRGRYGSRGMALAVACTGILATMPYIALQLIGIEAVLIVLGVTNTTVALIIAFAVLAGYTYLAGLRAPALIAFVKDTIVYVTVIVAVIYIPMRIGGWGHIFGAAATHLKVINPLTGKPHGSLIVTPAGEWAFATLALGSALALFMYPHVITGVLATKRRNVIRRNLAALPAYTLVLGIIALFGYMALATPAVNAGVAADHGNAQLSVPLLFSSMFPSWFAGVADAAIIIGALVPAAVMSIAAANLFTRTIYKELFRPYASPAEETKVARLASLLMKVGALGFALELNKTFSINLQLLGGIWILQTFPSVVIGLYTRWFHRAALIFGWLAGMAYGTIEAYRTSGGGQPHFGASASVVFGHTTYIAITALILNLTVSATLTVVFKGFGLQDGYDETRPADYIADPEPTRAPSPARAPSAAPAQSAAHAASAAPARSAVPTAAQPPWPAAPPPPARKAEPAADGRASRVSANPWSLDKTMEEARAAAPGRAPAVTEATAAATDATIVFDIPDALAGRPQSREHLPRRK